MIVIIWVHVRHVLKLAHGKLALLEKTEGGDVHGGGDGEVVGVGGR